MLSITLKYVELNSIFNIFERRKEMFYLMTHSTHFYFDIWLRTTEIMREEICHSFQLLLLVFVIIIFMQNIQVCCPGHTPQLSGLSL